MAVMHLDGFDSGDLVSQVYATAASSAPWTGTYLGTAEFGIETS